VPLRVEAPVLSADEQRWLAEAQSWVKASRTGLEHMRLDLDLLKPGPASQEPPGAATEQDLLETARSAALISRVEPSLRAAVEQRQPPNASAQDMQRLLRIIWRYGGWAMLIQKAKQAGEPPEIAFWRNLLEQTRPLWTGLGRSPIKTDRPLIYRWTERLFGLRGVLELASAEVDLLTTAYADASLDSELTLLWWDRELAPAAWRQPNPLFAGTQAGPSSPPILMVSRLDAPTADLAKNLVDKALRAERDGLRGTVYLDARGLPSARPTDTYGHYDQSLRDAAELLKRSSDYRVVLDNSEKTFSLPGEAPDVALYIGWYRLRSYEDAFVFNHGSIGYHMASAEAISVHDQGERGWCKNALERGIAVTLGSVGEPYLDAFPEPAQFVRLLLAGKYSLAEIYYLTSRYVSWRMVLFGDPLYNPKRGKATTDPASPSSLPIAPSDQPFSDPVAQLAQLRRVQEEHRAKLIHMLREAERGTSKTSE
jgi:uncharacterized protein (TIGR03790 family)